MSKKLLTSLALLVILAAPAIADDQVIGPFGGLNTQDNPASISASQSQDMLNVDINPGGKSVKKRKGLTRDNTFTISTGPVHGAYSFFDAQGNAVRLWGQDTGLWASVAGGTYVQVATGTTAATWQCTDYLGFAYCVTSAGDTPVKTAGTTATTTYQGSIPLGTMIASTPERLLVAGVATQPQRLYYSAASDFTNFTVGATAASSSYEDITSPGSKITHIAYYYGRWMWWKDQSFGYFLGTDQTNLTFFQTSGSLGTFDNTSVYDQGITYFRGTDNQFYTYDGTNFQRISRDITPTANSANRRKTASWQYTTAADWASGSTTLNGPSLSLSTAIVSGSIYPSSITVIDTSSTTFSQGAGPAIDTYTVAGAVTLRTYLYDDFASLANWTTDNGPSGSGPTMTASGGVGTCSSAASCTGVSSVTVNADYLIQIRASAGSGSNLLLYTLNSSNAGYRFLFNGNAAGAFSTVQITSFTNVYTGAGSATLGTRSISFSGPSTFTVTRNSGTGDLTVYVNGTSTLTVTNSDVTSFAAIRMVIPDNTWNVDGFYNIARVGNYTSRVFDTAFSTPIYGSFTTGTNSTGTFTYAVRCSSNSANTYTADATITSGSNITGCAVKRYLVYSATMTAPGHSATTLPQLQDVSVIAASTGTYYSAVRNASGLSSFGALGVTDATNGNSTITYYTRSSTAQFIVTSSTPNWVAQTKNAQVAASSGTYFQLRSDFFLTVASETPHIDDFTFNWFEGNAADKMYASYFDNSVWFSVSLGSSTSTNNRILRYDLITPQWNLYDIPSNGFLTYNAALYIGASNTGKSYSFGIAESDDSSAINSYWKSKDFFGSSPFVLEDFRTSSWYCKTSSGTTLTATYTLDQTTTTVQTISLYDSRANFIRANKNFAAGTTGNTFNVQIGDNSTNPSWECYAGNISYLPKPWVVYP